MAAGHARRQCGRRRAQAADRRRVTGSFAKVRVPETASKDLPSRGQVAVHGMVNGAEFQTVLEPDGNSGRWMRVGDTLRHVAGLSVDDTATFDWSEITPMAHWEWVRWVSATKIPARAAGGLT